jgi:hypothetical protein
MGAVAVLGGIWEIAFCASPVRAFLGGPLGEAMASVYSAGQVADAVLADAEFRALRRRPQDLLGQLRLEFD